MIQQTLSWADVKSTANWEPLEAKLSPQHCGEFMWMFRKDGIEYYKHILTREYLRLTGDGRCVVQRETGFEEADFDEEWHRVTGRSTGAFTYRDDK